MERKKAGGTQALSLLSGLSFLLARSLHPQVGIVAHPAPCCGLGVARLALLADKRVCDFAVCYWKLAH